MLALRGHGVTRLADALRAASAELAGARAQRQVVVLLSDCRHTDEDPLPVARTVPELVVLGAARRRRAGARLRDGRGREVRRAEGAGEAPALLRDLL